MNLPPDLTDAIKDILQLSELPLVWNDEQGFHLKQRLAVSDPELLEQLELALSEGENGEVLESEGRVARTRSGVNDGFKSLYCDQDAFSGEWNPSRTKIGAWVGALVMVPLIGMTVFGSISAQSVAAVPVVAASEAVVASDAKTAPVGSSAPNVSASQRSPQPLGSARVSDAGGAADAGGVSVAPADVGSSAADGFAPPAALSSNQPITAVSSAPSAVRVRQPLPSVSWGVGPSAVKPGVARPGAARPSLATPVPAKPRPSGAAPLTVAPSSAARPSAEPNVSFASDALGAAAVAGTPAPSAGASAGASSSAEAPQAAPGASAAPEEPAVSSGSSQVFQRPGSAAAQQPAPQPAEQPASSGPVSSSVFSSAPQPAAERPSSQGSAVFGSSKPVVVAVGKPVSSSVLTSTSQTAAAPGASSGSSAGSSAVNPAVSLAVPPGGAPGKPAVTAAAAPLVQQSRYNPGDVIVASVAVSVDVPANSLVPVIWRDADSSEWYGTAKLVGSRVVIDLKSVLFGGVAYAVRARVVAADGSVGLPVSIVQRSPEQAEQAVESGFTALRDTLGQTVGDPTKALPANLGGLAWAFAESTFGFLGGGNRVTIPTGVVKTGLVGNIVVL